ncbi:MAG: ATP-binding protein, partial [Betaproteobacteria bacterium]|nr:ATP-binding protein [Betaproteobacteria bacterium]
GRLRDLQTHLEQRVEERTREALGLKQQLDTVLSSVQDVVWSMTTDGRVRFVNRAAERLFGVPLEAIRGADGFLRAAVVAEDRGVYDEALRRVLAGGEASAQLRIAAGKVVAAPAPPGESGVRWVNARFVAVRGADAAVAEINATISDITQLEAAKEEAERANRAKSLFLSNMSHELRTPLNAVIGYAELLENDPRQPLSVEQKEAVSEIMGAGTHLLALISDLLEMSKIDVGTIEIETENVGVWKLIDDCVRLTRLTALKQGVRVQVPATREEGLACRADYLRLRQVVLNLITNAIKYNRPDGFVTLLADGTEQGVRIRVVDSGVGIPRERMAELFAPFSRLGKEGSGIDGSGIGLSLSYRLVQLMGGTMGAESELGVGSTFWVTIPGVGAAVPGVPPPSREAVAKKEAAVLAEKSALPRVLYIEDNTANMRLMDAMLRRIGGAEMIPAHSAVLGIEFAVTQAPSLIFMDINMPGVNGFEALQRLRGLAETRDIPIVAVSAHATRADIERGLAAGFAAYLTKPVDIREVAALLTLYLGLQMDIESY